MTKAKKSRTTLKDAKLKVDIKHVEQKLLRPFAPFKFDLRTPEGFYKFTENLIQAAFEHRIDGRIGGMINGAVSNWIRYTQPPPGLNVTVTQTVSGMTEADWKKKFESTPEAERLIIAKFIKGLGSGESSPSVN